MTTTRNNNFWTTILIAMIPVVLGSGLSGIYTYAKLTADTKERIAVISQRMAGHEQLNCQQFENMEKLRVEQYRYIKDQTDDIKNRLNIIQKLTYNMRFDTGGVWIVHRGGIWYDSTAYYAYKADSIYLEVVSNFKIIKGKIQTIN